MQNMLNFAVFLTVFYFDFHPEIFKYLFFSEKNKCAISGEHNVYGFTNDWRRTFF